MASFGPVWTPFIIWMTYLGLKYRGRYATAPLNDLINWFVCYTLYNSIQRALELNGNTKMYSMHLK